MQGDNSKMKAKMASVDKDNLPDNITNFFFLNYTEGKQKILHGTQN